MQLACSARERSSRLLGEARDRLAHQVLAIVLGLARRVDPSEASAHGGDDELDSALFLPRGAI